MTNPVIVADSSPLISLSIIEQLETAIANAVYHATGKRIRELPITPDKLL